MTIFSKAILKATFGKKVAMTRTLKKLSKNSSFSKSKRPSSGSDGLKTTNLLSEFQKLMNEGELTAEEGGKLRQLGCGYSPALVKLL
jgi:hypothetical protein